MRHRSELGVNSEQHQTDIEVIMQRRRNEIECNVVEVFAFSVSFGGGGCGGFALCHSHLKADFRVFLKCTYIGD